MDPFQPLNELAEPWMMEQPAIKGRSFDEKKSPPIIRNDFGSGTILAKPAEAGATDEDADRFVMRGHLILNVIFAASVNFVGGRWHSAGTSTLSRGIHSGGEH